jgi:hypothetical protein
VGTGRLVVLVLLVAGAVLLAHRGLLAMERRGWVYYRHRGRASAGAGLGALDEVFHPSAQLTVVEEREAEQRGPRGAVPGDPPGDGT